MLGRTRLWTGSYASLVAGASCRRVLSAVGLMSCTRHTCSGAPKRSPSCVLDEHE